MALRLRFNTQGGVNEYMHAGLALKILLEVLGSHIRNWFQVKLTPN